MQPVMSVSDVREFESSLAEKGLNAQELMRRAGAVVALQTARLVDAGSVVVLCGMGNNGGDGWVAADNLARHGYEVNVVTAATPALIKGEVARRMASRAAEMGVPVHVDPSYDELSALLESADVVVDAVFGTGFKGTMPSPYDMWVRAVDDVFTGALVAVDVPSGINATSGMSEGPYFDADVTVTMFAMKPGLISGEGRRAAGTVVVASLASDDEGLSDLSDAAAAFTLAEADYADVLPEADPLQDKYTRGRVLVVAGSGRYPGAAVMAAMAAARAGAGYVTLAVPASVVPVAQAHLLSVPVVGLPCDEEGSFAAAAADMVGALAAKADAVLCGPGLTTTFGACEVVRRLLAEPCALVLDADALNALVKICTGSAEEHPEALRRDHALVLTPHRRELARLVGAEVGVCASLAGAMRAAQSLAWSVGSADFCVVAKGPVTAVSTIDSTLIPEPGPAALATAGTGDVLAGIVASMLAQSLAQLEPDEGIGSSDLLMLMAAADRVHALAGHLAAAERGSRGVVAPDVAERVGLAVDALVETAARAAEEAGEDEGSRLEGALAFEDESRISPPPEVERLIRADAAAARAAKLPGELKAFCEDLEEPPSVAGAVGAPCAATGDAEDEGLDPAPVPADGSAPAEESPETPDASGGADGDGADGEAGTEAPQVALPADDEGKPAPDGAEGGDAPATGDGPASGGDSAAGVSPAAPATPVAVPPFLAAVAAPVAEPSAATAQPDAGEQAAQSAEPAASAPAAEGLVPDGQPSFSEDPSPARPASGGDAPAMPPFLARAVAPAASADATTIMPPIVVTEDIGVIGAAAGISAWAGADGALAGEAAPEPEPARPRELTPEEIERRRIELFHERATLHIDDEDVTPVDKRPSARRERHR